MEQFSMGDPSRVEEARELKQQVMDSDLFEALQRAGFLKDEALVHEFTDEEKEQVLEHLIPHFRALNTYIDLADAADATGMPMELIMILGLGGIDPSGDRGIRLDDM